MRVLVPIAVVIAAFSIVAEGETFYCTDFESEAGPEWSIPRISTTPIGNDHFLGQFGNESVTLTLPNLPQHSSVTVAFDLYIIESWDGDAYDTWTVDVGPGLRTFRTSFINDIRPPVALQAYPGTLDQYPNGNYPAHTGAARINELGFTSWDGVPMDSVYHMELTVPHNASSLVVVFSSQTTSALESFGLDNVCVTPEPAALAVLALGGLALLRRRRQAC